MDNVSGHSEECDAIGGYSENENAAFQVFIF